MKTYHIILSALLATAIVSCDGNDILPETPEIPETPEQPTDSVATEGYQFTFDGSVGTDEETTRASWTGETEDDKGRHLVFGWDYTDEKNPTYDMKMAFFKTSGNYAQNVVTSKDSKENTNVKIVKHPYQKDNRHWAELKTVETYSNALSGYNIDKIIAVNGAGATISFSESNTSTRRTGTMSLSAMPNTFTQSESNPYGHLRDYMYMYAISTIQNGSASLEFIHLTAPIRFRVHNWRPGDAKIYSVKMEAIANRTSYQFLASQTVTVNHSGTITYSSTTNNKNTRHQSITVKSESNAGFTVAENDYIDLYAHILPMKGGSNNTLQNKTLRFTIEANDAKGGSNKVSYTTSLDEITGANFYSATGSYNWIAGDLYTFNIYLDDVIGVSIEKVSIKDWVDEDLGTNEAV